MSCAGGRYTQLIPTQLFYQGLTQVFQVLFKVKAHQGVHGGQAQMDSTATLSHGNAN